MWCPLYSQYVAVRGGSSTNLTPYAFSAAPYLVYYLTTIGCISYAPLPSQQSTVTSASARRDLRRCVRTAHSAAAVLHLLNAHTSVHSGII
mmetsp:Transcript_37295/g.102949  ORF Transcript_37295/g.102949 Transcript_37295/m.102949 type:complete len:91 (+) Transcript_37295:3457-3729(+)